MGSLFDGIGGFPLAAVRNGIRPVWASEIEAFPIEVTKLRFPNMVHVGDITRLNGAELPPVNIICGGSPCQDLSVAGARARLAGARSGLFMEQVRLTKEMRNADELRGRTAIDVVQHNTCAGWIILSDSLHLLTARKRHIHLLFSSLSDNFINRVRIHSPSPPWHKKPWLGNGHPSHKGVSVHTGFSAKPGGPV